MKSINRRYRIWAFCNALWYLKGDKKIPQEKWLCRKYNELIVSLESPHRSECICFFLNAISSIPYFISKWRCLNIWKIKKRKMKDNIFSKWYININFSGWEESSKTYLEYLKNIYKKKISEKIRKKNIK